MSRSFKITNLLVGLGIIVFDQLTKYLANNKLPSNGVFIVEQDFLELKLAIIKNQFMAFGLKLAPIIIYALLFIIFIVLLNLLIKSFKKDNKILSLTLTIIISAALSNIIDRIIHGGVVDFISVTVYNFQWPTFNAADMFISVAMIILLIIVLKRKKKN